jgi:asparagine synthetase B (glutamine-hydrolysing)
MTDNIVVPVSGGLDSTLIVKALYDLGLENDVQYVTMYGNEYADKVAETYSIKLDVFTPDYKEEDLVKMVEILEEPFYSPSVNYYLYEKIHSIGGRVSLSGLGADELFGGYDYYNTNKYPRGLFKEVVAISNKEKKAQDLHFLTNHHLRENEKLGLYWQVEGRYPFLDKVVSKTDDNGKSLIKDILLRDFSDDFVNRQKEGFRIDDNKDREHQKQHYMKQLNIWKQIFMK